MFLKDLFLKFKVYCTDMNANLVIIERRGYPITLQRSVYDDLLNQGYVISTSLYKGKPSSVVLRRTTKDGIKENTTLKAYLNVKSFKDSDSCNFKPSNLILKDK